MHEDRMEILVTFGFAYLSLFESFQALPAATCTGINGTSCCTGFKWNLTQKMCLPCEKGYRGLNCEIKCPFPLYGFHCQMNCHCIAKHCDPVNGCKRSTTVCRKGYNGTKCETRCPYPSYGLGCQTQCNCIDKDCDHVSGCMQSAKDHPTSKDFQHITATAEYMESEYNMFKNNSDNKPPNDKTTTCKTSNQEPENNNSLKFAIIGLLIVAFIIYICLLVHTTIRKTY